MDESTVDSTTAEFFGLLEALKEAVCSGVRRLWVGTDSYQLIEHLNKRTPRYARFAQAIEAYLPLFDSLKLQAIERTRNKQADALARKGIAHVR
jgi:ribonuclease HI